VNKFTYEQCAKKIEEGDATKVLVDMQKSALDFVRGGWYQDSPFAIVYGCWYCKNAEYSKKGETWFCTIGGFIVACSDVCKRCYPTKIDELFKPFYNNCIIGSMYKLSENENKDYWVNVKPMTKRKEEIKYVVADIRSVESYVVDLSSC